MKPNNFLLALMTLSGLSVGCWLLASEVDAPRPPVWVPAPEQRAPEPMRSSWLRPEGHASAPQSRALFLGLAVLPLGALAALALALAARHRDRARGAIEGVVEVEPGEQPAVIEVRIFQRGSEYEDGRGVTHAWTEIDRLQTVRAFQLRLDDGRRALVEPDQRVMVRDALTRMERKGPDARARLAQIVAGDRITVEGELLGATPPKGGSAYRSGGEALVVRAPEGGRMILGTRRGRDLEGAAQRLHLAWAAIFAAALVFDGAVLARRFLLLSIDGVTVEATPTEMASWPTFTHARGTGTTPTVMHYAVRGEATLPSGRREELESACSLSLHDAVRGRHAGAVPFVVAAHAPAVSQTGVAPTLAWGKAAAMALVLAAGAALFAWTAWTQRPWYARKRVDDTGDGPLVPLDDGG